MNELLLDDEIGFWGISSKEFITKLNAMKGDVTIKISSPGGDVFQGIEIFNAIKDYDKGEITIVITSLAASMASYIALAGDVIKAYDNATYMIHNAWTFAWGDHRDMRHTADVLEGLTTILSKKYISKTGKAQDEVKQLCDDESYFYGEEILTHGFCDEIISTDEDVTKSEALALGKEKFKACSKNMSDNFNKDEFVQTAAKLTKDGFLGAVVIEEKQESAICANYEQRKRELDLLEREI